MTNRKLGLRLIGALVLVPAFGALAGAQDQEPEPTFYSSKGRNGDQTRAVPHPLGVNVCRGPVRQVQDVAFEGVRTTTWNFMALGGGGEGGRFDPVPVLSAVVQLTQGCLNAHFSAIVGSRQTYGPAFSAMTLFQVAITPVTGGGPQHLVGHYETPYGFYAPAVAVEAERDVDTFGANSFIRVGTAPGDVPPGLYRVAVFWAGGPIGGGGAIGAGFALKLYQN
jgi:hypothetical protein